MAGEGSLVQDSETRGASCVYLRSMALVQLSQDGGMHDIGHASKKRERAEK